MFDTCDFWVLYRVRAHHSLGRTPASCARRLTRGRIVTVIPNCSLDEGSSPESWKDGTQVAQGKAATRNPLFVSYPSVVTQLRAYGANDCSSLALTLPQ
jgi:hypothetical protein